MDPIITPSVALIGAGTWFANKLLGPSAEALGEQLKVYASERLSKIFLRAQALSENDEIGVLPPGFAFIALQKASFSDDEDAITDMWASLLLNAAANYQSKHALFADIISQISGQSAELLRGLAENSQWRFEIPSDVSLRNWIYSAYRGGLDWQASSPKIAKERADELVNMNIGWPVSVENAQFNWYDESGVAGKNSGSELAFGAKLDSFVLDVLTRQCLVERFSFDFHPGWASPEMSGVYLTQLGRELILACDRKKG